VELISDILAFSAFSSAVIGFSLFFLGNESFSSMIYTPLFLASGTYTFLS